MENATTIRPRRAGEFAPTRPLPLVAASGRVAEMAKHAAMDGRNVFMIKLQFQGGRKFAKRRDGNDARTSRSQRSGIAYKMGDR